MADVDAPVEFLPTDLAPGDGRALELDRRDLVITRIRSGDDPLFALAYDGLWAEFGAQHEMEPEEIVRQRLDWARAAKLDGYAMRYEMILVRRQEQFVAVRDQTAVVSCRGQPQSVVHLSHVLVAPAWRRTGLAGWLRAWPLQTARACLTAAGLPTNSPVTLLAEMEHLDAQFPNRLIRLKAYEKAGFKKVDPAAVNYVQPDFRPPAAIDASGGPRPLPFSLIVRRVGREEEPAIPGAEVRAIVECLYHMYGAGFREQDMAGVWDSLRNYPGDDTLVRLVAPTANQ